MKHILLIDSHIELLQELVMHLGFEDTHVDISHDAEYAKRRAITGRYDLIVLGVLLSQTNGFSLLKQIRQQIDTPILLLSVLGDDIDRIIGFQQGADECLPRCCHPRELSARIRRLLRDDLHRQRKINGQSLQVDDTVLDMENRSASHAGVKLSLTVSEFHLLQVLMRNAGRAVDKNILAEQVLGRKLEVFDRSIDVMVSRLRRKLTLGADRPSPIATIRGIGYQFLCRERRPGEALHTPALLQARQAR